MIGRLVGWLAGWLRWAQRVLFFAGAEAGVSEPAENMPGQSQGGE